MKFEVKENDGNISFEDDFENDIYLLSKVLILYNNIMFMINKDERFKDATIIKSASLLLLIKCNEHLDIHLKSDIWEQYENFNKLYQKLNKLAVITPEEYEKSMKG
jgi:hypothetical protein